MMAWKSLQLASKPQIFCAAIERKNNIIFATHLIYNCKPTTNTNECANVSHRVMTAVLYSRDFG